VQGSSRTPCTHVGKVVVNSTRAKLFVPKLLAGSCKDCDVVGPCVRDKRFLTR